MLLEWDQYEADLGKPPKPKPEDVEAPGPDADPMDRYRFVMGG